MYTDLFFQIYLTYCIVTVFVRKSESLIIAKSHITICENTDKDPLNVVYNKKCEKKLVVVARVKSGQRETEKLYVKISKAYDRVEKEQARLYNPFMVTLSMSPLFLVYPIYYVGTVNNKPYERMKPKRKALCRGGDVGCDPHYDEQGKEIFDSKGFCCTCERSGIFSFPHFYSVSRANDKTNYFRGMIDCDKYMSSAHCMAFDSLWYDAHEIGVFTFDFTIWVKAYDQVERVKGNRTVIDWVDGGQIDLSPKKTGGVGKHGRLIAKYIGTFSSGREYPRLHDFYMMIPNSAKMTYGFRTHPQLINGYQDYLIIPIGMVEFNNSRLCDVIGVSLSAFAQQSTFYSKTGYGCYQKQGTCLRNQIKDLFEEDQLRRDKGKRTKYFPETYGKITGLKKRRGSTDRVVEFESDETHSVLVHLEISADDLILVYNRAGGVIVKAFAKKFEAQSRNGKATVVVQNTGLVTADFYVSENEVTLEGCSKGINAGGEQTASINPQKNHEFEFRLQAYGKEGGSFSCNANLFDARRKRVDSRVISINTTGTCVCIGSCGCSCTDQKFTCINQSNVVFDQAKPGTYRDFMDNIASKLGVVFDAIGGVFKTVMGVKNFLWNLLPLLGQVKSFLIIVAFVILLCVVRMVYKFVPTGVFTSILKKAVKSSKPENNQLPAPAPTVVIRLKDSESSEDSDEDEERDETKAETKSPRTMKTAEFLFEFFFFFILPFLLIHKAARWLYLLVKETFVSFRDDEGFSEVEDHDESGGEEDHSEGSDNEVCISEDSNKSGTEKTDGQDDEN